MTSFSRALIRRCVWNFLLETFVDWCLPRIKLETREGFLRKPLGCRIGIKRRDIWVMWPQNLLPCNKQCTDWLQWGIFCQYQYSVNLTIRHFDMTWWIPGKQFLCLAVLVPYGSATPVHFPHFVAVAWTCLLSFASYPYRKWFTEVTNLSKAHVMFTGRRLVVTHLMI